MKNCVCLYLSGLLLTTGSYAQTIGGNTAFPFLKLPASPLLTAAGGVNTSYAPDEVSLTANNPALLAPSLHGQMASSFNSFFSGIKTYSLAGAWHREDLNTSFGGNVFYVDYGAVPATDAAGNVSGEFRPREFAVQLAAARRYLQRWVYGGTLKFVNAAYGPFRSSAVAVDIGLLYTDSARGLRASILAKNMGLQLQSFGGTAEDLPFDLQVGLTKRLAKAPFGFSLTAQQVHRFNLQYNDTVFNNENGLTAAAAINNFFLHFVAATHLYIGPHLEVTVGYNHLRRHELSVPGSSNGLAGFSAGLHLHFRQLQVQAARATYLRGQAYTQLGLTVNLSKLGGLGN